jgi:hypothetical protein
VLEVVVSAVLGEVLLGALEDTGAGFVIGAPVVVGAGFALLGVGAFNSGSSVDA